ncbi:phenylacetic acid degradation-related protein [Thermodesulfobium narugense DSM 14796]|uniref:Phenylacetic acid degradation-related protein n=1 Tax=Thermodesulfobium narugense DSM 14796 TaxID=747365 RepID=M1E7H1_9BACT|nr:hotdog fold thioesterase [Thermodesulfobium narugense]AEE14643.1 phenylacetic acid degradation-related protein [Thermodesulfobium narugense DSM 14796]
MNEKIVKFMRENDKVAVWLNVKILEVRTGYSKISMIVREDMLNSVKICQGGVIFSFADFAFALASNSHGKIAVGISANINYLKPSLAGEELIAECFESGRSRKLGLYDVKVYKNKNKELIASFTGQVYIKEERFEV